MAESLKNRARSGNIQFLPFEDSAPSNSSTATDPAYRNRRPKNLTVTLSCERCGAIVVRPLWHAERPIHSYCSRKCYRAWMRQQGKNYRSYRHGQRIARRVVAQHFPLLPGHVVHHHDKNHHNNALTNLAVFASQREHMSFHRGGAGRPIWNGADLRGEAAITGARSQPSHSQGADSVVDAADLLGTETGGVLRYAASPWLM